MSHVHLRAALRCRIPGKYPDKTERMLIALAMRASAGRPLRNGKVIPFGVVKVSDKVLMPEMNTERRQTVTDCRKDLLAAGVIRAERKPNKFRGKSTFPVYEYVLDLNKMNKLAGIKPTESVAPTQTVADDQQLLLEKAGVDQQKVRHNEGSSPRDGKEGEEHAPIPPCSPSSADRSFDNDNNRVVSSPKTLPVKEGKETVAGYTEEQVKEHVARFPRGHWVEVNATGRYWEREGFVRHVMGVDPPKRAAKPGSHADINPELHTGKRADGKDWINEENTVNLDDYASKKVYEDTQQRRCAACGSPKAKGYACVRCGGGEVSDIGYVPKHGELNGNGGKFCKPCNYWHPVNWTCKKGSEFNSLPKYRQESGRRDILGKGDI